MQEVFEHHQDSQREVPAYLTLPTFELSLHKMSGHHNVQKQVIAIYWKNPLISVTVFF